MLLQRRATVSVSGLAMMGLMIIGLTGCSSSSTPSTPTAKVEASTQPSAAPAKAQVAPSGWHVTAREDAEATLTISPDGVMKLDIAQLGDEKKWLIRLAGSDVSVKAGDRYTISFRAKASAPCKMLVKAAEGQPPWGSIGMPQRASLTEEWQSFRFDVDSQVDAPQARLVFELRASSPTVEIADATFGPQTASPATQEAEGVDGGPPAT